MVAAAASAPTAAAAACPATAAAGAAGVPGAGFRLLSCSRVALTRCMPCSLPLECLRPLLPFLSGAEHPGGRFRRWQGLVLPGRQAVG